MDEIGVQADHAEDPAAPGPSAPNLVVVPDGNVVTLHPRVTIPIGIAALSVIKQGGGQAVIEAGLAEVYLRFGITSWTYPDEVTVESVARLLPYDRGGLEVAEAADGLYSGAVLAPLAQRLSRPSPTGPTGPSTHRTPATGSTPRTPSGRSSRSATAGKRSGGRAR